MKTYSVMFVIESLNIGGAEVYLDKLLRHLDRKRFRPFVCCLVEKGSLAGSLEAIGIPVVTLDWRIRRRGPAGGRGPGTSPVEAGSSRFWARVRFYLSTVAVVFRLARLMRSERVDLVQTFFYRPEVVTALARWLGGMPCVVGSQYDTIAPRGLFSRLMLRLLRPGVAHVIANCGACSSHRQRLSGHEVGQISVIHIGLSAEELTRADGARAVTPPGVAGDSSLTYFLAQGPVVLFTGRLLPLKGPDVFVRAASLLHQKVPGVKFLLLGEGPMRSDLAALVARLGIGSVLRMPGEVEVLAPVLARSSVLVCSSRSEGFPSTVLEAMALGVPVVASSVGGVGELIEHGVDGLLFESGDQAGLASMLETLLSDGELRARIGERAKKKVREKYRFDDTVSQTQDLYTRLMGGGGV